MKILSLSDKPVSFVYSPQIRARFWDVDLIIGCGDLSYHYLEYALNALDVPLFYVRGNHDHQIEYSARGGMQYPHGGTDLHCCTATYRGLLLAGVEGSIRYRPGPFQYAQSEMWWHVFRLVPALLSNRLRYGRYLDVFVSHAPPSGVHDCSDLPHQGVKAFTWLVTTFQPSLFFHGHIHIYRPDEIRKTMLGQTCIINSYAYYETVIDWGNNGKPKCR